MPPPPVPPPRAPLRRGEHARRRILRAALRVLAEHGMPGFSIEAVARQARASKATLYRHWPSASALLVDAMDAEFQPLSHVDTGDLRADLIALLSGFTAMVADSPFPKLMAAFIDAAERDPALTALHTTLTGRRREPVLSLLRAAARRGEIRDDADLELVVDLLAAPFFYRRFIAHRPIPDSMPAAVVDQVLATLRDPNPDPDPDPESA